jgi:hypothetical protein
VSSVFERTAFQEAGLSSDIFSDENNPFAIAIGKARVGWAFRRSRPVTEARGLDSVEKNAVPHESKRPKVKRSSNRDRPFNICAARSLGARLPTTS